MGYSPQRLFRSLASLVTAYCPNRFARVEEPQNAEKSNQHNLPDHGNAVDEERQTPADQSCFCQIQDGHTKKCLSGSTAELYVRFALTAKARIV